MNLVAEIRTIESNPAKLEKLYQNTKRKNKTEDFQVAIETCYEEDRDNLLLAAWHYRLQGEVVIEEEHHHAVNWALALPLSILTGLIFWYLSDFDAFTYLDLIPTLVLWWSPIATMSALIFLSFTAKKNQMCAVALGLGLLSTAAYAMLLAPSLGVDWKINQYLILAAIHIPLLSWIALGIMVLGFKSNPEERFAFLIKSIEVMITAGLYLIAGVVLGVITIGMFEALSITLPEIWMRLIVAGGFGLLPVLAVATAYDPTKPPLEQNFDQGLSKFIATMMRLLLPMTLGVLLIYMFVIPFKFLEPFQNRDVLIVYNIMLFAIMGLLIGATPISGDDLSSNLQKWLRAGIITVAILAVLVSVYALSAVIYRTIDGGMTINRSMIIGWNTINIAVLLMLIYKQFKFGYERWIDSLHAVFSLARTAYLVWALILVLTTPWLFR